MAKGIWPWVFGMIIVLVLELVKDKLKVTNNPLPTCDMSQN